MTLAELQRALTSVEPGAVLVPPRVMEHIIRQVLQLSAVVWTVPHRTSWIVDRTLLFRHVDQGDLALAPDQILPATVLLLSWPPDDELLREPAGTVLLKTWRQLFHASLHQAVDRAWQDGHLTAPRLREFIDSIGPAAFEEIGTVLVQETFLPGAGDERAVFNEFVAVFLELNAFAPHLLLTYFPGLRDPQVVKRTLDGIFPSDEILQRTRLPGAPDRQRGQEARPSEANEFFHELEVSGDAALARGNMVYAAIEFQRAARVAPGDKAPSTLQRAENILQQLRERFAQALELPEVERSGWARLLPILLEKADQGTRPAEAGLLYELQKVCLDHEREIYKLDIVEWLLSAGRRPLQRPLPSQRMVRITRTLRSSMTYLNAARLSDQDRAELENLLQRALHRSEERVRSRFRPILSNALQDVGLVPRHPLETVAFRKMVEELVDRIIEYGFLNFSDLRDIISRNQLKLADLTEPVDFIRGDPLIRLDRRLSTILDGVYRPGEFYLRWLERFTSFNFGTKIGRFVTRCVTLPVGGGYLLVQTIQLFSHPSHQPTDSIVTQEPSEVIGPNPPALPAIDAEVTHGLPGWAFYALWFFFSVIIFGLMHSPDLRGRIGRLMSALGRGLQYALVEVPMGLVRRYELNKILTSGAFQFFYGFVLKPALLLGLVLALVPDLRRGIWETGLEFLVANALVNSRPGEAFWDAIVKAVQGLFELLRSGLVPGLIRFIVRLSKQLLHSIEAILFTVDEWLRFRGGESNRAMTIRTLITIVWLPISYLIRFNLVVFIEPCLNPLKLPVCSIATKFYLPFIGIVNSSLYDGMSPVLGSVTAKLLAWWITFWLPDVVGFVFWEMKENWTLFRANRRQTLGSAAVGAHGETVRGLFQPGFHSGTLPKLFARIRHAELAALKSGNYSAVRQSRATQQELEEVLAKFATRELCYLLDLSPAWRGQALEAAMVELASNQVRFYLADPRHPGEPLVLSIDYRSRWVVARLEECPWLAKLDPAARQALHNALVIFYKLATIDLIHEHLGTLLPNPADHYDVTSYGLAIWPPDRQGPPLHVYLVPREPHEALAAEGTSLTWDPQRVVFSQRRLTRDECFRSWPERSETTDVPPPLLADIRVFPGSAETPPLPPEAKDEMPDILDFKQTGAA